MRKKCDVLICKFFILAAVQFLLFVAVANGHRRLAIGERVPEFSATDVNEQVFEYKHGGGKVLLMVFLSGRQKQSTRATTDIKRIVSKLGSNVERLDIAVAVDEPNIVANFQSNEKKLSTDIHIFLDTGFKLWGKFGIIATPTVIISDTNDTVLWVEAGYGYDFAPVIQARMNQALDIAQEIDPNDAGQVKTIQNATVAARIKRHLQMAKMLQKKGKLEPAIRELQKAMVMDPNSVDILFELGEIFCKDGRNQAALDLVEGVKVTKQFEKARIHLISGWAKRQMGELDAAEELLLKATALDPKSSRSFFELGKIYQTKGEIEKAMRAYRKALSMVFGKPVIKTVSH
ncbi:MAG: tetratricopeptide repeat protein [Planctomycetota bacterium]|jgi:Tfp pilus assembly protein PilF